MEEKKLVPKRRYQGFTEDWDKSKLENLASFSKGKGYSKKDLTDIGHQLILYGRLYTNYETVIKKVDTYTIKQENSMLSKGREVIVPSSGETKEDIARASVILEPNIIIGGDLNVIIPSKELDSVFLALNISKGSCQSELMKRAQGSSVVHLYNEDLISVTLYFPCVKEQQKISEFFKVLDDRIANQERKIAKVKALKEAYLTEMFPQEGETVPKRRFKGFEGEWKAFKLKDLGMFTSNGVNKKVNKNEMLVNLLNYMDVYKRKKITNENRHTLMQVTANLDQIKKNSVEKNDVFFTPSSETPDDIGRVMVIEESLDNTVYSYHLMRFRPYRNILHSIFPNYVFDTFYFRKQLEFAAQGVQRYVLNRDAFEELLVQLPRINEQKAISDFFRTLDDQIEMEEKKLDKLQKMKEAYLEEMFV